MNKMDEIIFECYRKMFKEAEPSVDFDKLYKKGITKKENFFMDYFLSIDRIGEICLEIAKENKLKKHITQQLLNTCMLGCSPTSCRETWKKK